MYTTLLGSALQQRDESDHLPTIGDLFGHLVRNRSRLPAGGTHQPERAGTLGAVTTQLNYDLSLISLARRLGIDFAVDRFDNGERLALERALLEHGIPLNDVDERR